MAKKWKKQASLAVTLRKAPRCLTITNLQLCWKQIQNCFLHKKLYRVGQQSDWAIISAHPNESSTLEKLTRRVSKYVPKFRTIEFKTLTSYEKLKKKLRLKMNSVPDWFKSSYKAAMRHLQKTCNFSKTWKTIFCLRIKLKST